ncbi:CRISPR-associated protein Cas4 [Desulfovibrio legallii]|uniref:CRISPR-associated exonuclease Cas4 n=1 Tax=Desulfovibrio legallii TaxID=571438 RepID=A0A1G7NA08_9BACT|nr:CRISPR-associated protein Cas4 [Desulfovibrio legallii]SDF70747.1 CRISPR-associated exonuclease, Cas4 family [Desulfovibrio legallii]
MDDLLPLSALQHYLYCPRQCALIHLEGVWEENRFTAEGRLLHRRVDAGSSGARDGVAEDRSVPVRSERLGLYGIADLVERRGGAAEHGAPGAETTGAVYPVEYKRGSPKVEDWDRAQLCAQALCLEEMLGRDIPEGAIFYGQPRRRERVIFDARLRAATAEACRGLHALLAGGRIPPGRYGPRCRGCSLLSHCMPKAPRQGVEAYLLQGLTS